MAKTLFKCNNVYLFIVTVLAIIIFRNTFFLAVNDETNTVEEQPREDNPDLRGSDQGPLTLRDVAGLIRAASPAVRPDKDEKVDVVKELIVFSNSSLKNSSSLNKNTNVKNDTKLTILKANMSHVGEIVKGLKATVNPEQPVKYAKPHPFKYVINNPNICGKDEVFMLIYIHTAPDHLKRRTIIRQTWGNLELYDVPVRLIFVMGVTKLVDNLNETEIQKALFFESEQFGDIVQEDFLDTYHNLSHKGVTALKWITNYCPQAVFILKTDDDIFVNPYTLVRHMKRLHARNEVTGWLMCAVWYQMTVVREGKWKVTEEEWPNSTYPTYCSGSAFILSTDVAIKLYWVSYHVPFFWVDDFYITGLLPLKAGNITHTDIGSMFVLNGDRLEEMFTGSQWYMYLFSHVHNLNRIQNVWDIMTKYARGKTKVTIKMEDPGVLEAKDSIERKIGLL